MFKVIDCEFNQANYKDLVGLFTENPPGYAIVQVINAHRKWTCWDCKHEWIAKVERTIKGGITNITGEKTTYCPKCGKAASMGSEWIDEDGLPIHFNPKFK